MRSTIVAGLTYAALLPFGAEGDLQADLDLVAAETSAKYNCTIAVSALVPDKKINVTSVAGKVSFLHGAPSTSPTEQFIWGSITKISTGSAILRLVEEGKITIDDTIPQYVDPMIAQMHSVDPDGFKYNSSEDLWGPEVADVTIRHLATMSSGIPDFDTAKPWPPPPVDPLRATIYNNSAHDYLPPELFSLPWVRARANLHRCSLLCLHAVILSTLCPRAPPITGRHRQARVQAWNQGLRVSCCPGLCGSTTNHVCPGEAFNALLCDHAWQVLVDEFHAPWTHPRAASRRGELDVLRSGTIAFHATHVTARHGTALHGTPRHATCSSPTLPL